MQSLYRILILSFLLSGCGKAWIVSQYSRSGVIGYQGFSDSQKAHDAIEKLIPCRPYSVTADELRSQQKTFTTLETRVKTTHHSGRVNNNWRLNESYNYSGTATEHEQVPVNHTVTDSWRELTYQCD